jgi:hypothetical protein
MLFLKHHKDFLLGDVTAIGGTNGLVGNALAAILSTRAAPELVAVELNGLAGLAGKVVDDHGLYCHLADVSRMGAVEFRAQDFRKVVINEHLCLSSSVAGQGCQVKDLDKIVLSKQILAVDNLSTEYYT